MFGVWMMVAALSAAGCLATAGQLVDALAGIHARDACTAVSAALEARPFVWSARHRELGDSRITGLVLTCRALTLVGALALGMAYASALPHGAHGAGLAPPAAHA